MSYTQINSFGSSFKRLKALKALGIPFGPDLPTDLTAADGLCLFVHTDEDFNNGVWKWWDGSQWIDLNDPDRYGEATSDPLAPNDYQVTFSPPMNVYNEGSVLKIKFPTANTGTATLEPGTLPAREIVLPGGASLSGGELKAGGIHFLFVTDTKLQLIGGAGGSSGGGDMAKSIYDPTGINADAFDWNNFSNKPTLNKPFAIVDDNFEDGINSSLTLSTGWTVGTDGIAISSNGGWGNSALYNKHTTIDRVSTRALIQVINAGSVFCVIRKPISPQSQFGTVVKVDCGAKTISFMGTWDGSTTATTSVKSVTIPFTIVANGKYLLELKKDKAKFIASFTDETNPANTVSITYDNEVDTASGAGRQWSAPGVMFISGSIKLKRFTYASLFSYAPKVLITGHSFVEGYALVNSGNVAGTYSNLLYNALNGDIAVAGLGGETIATLNQREDINFFLPTYHMVDIGSNDTTYSTWLSGIQTYIGKILAQNSIPVLCTIVPRADRQTFINSANTWIRSSGYNYVDFAKAITVGNDGVTMDASLMWTDSVHPNVAGNLKMFEQIKIDAPYLWDGAVVAPQSSPSSDFSVSEVLKTSNFSVSNTDKFKLYVINSASAITVTLPTGLTSGNWWEFLSIGDGQVTFVAGGGATVISPDSRLKMRAKNSYARAIARASNQISLGGDLVL